MSYLSLVAIRAITLLVGCFLASLVVLRIIIAIIQHGPKKVFNVKKRPKPPDCMQEKDLGVHGFAHLEDVRVHYVSAGTEGKSLMLLIHGFPEFWYSWRHQLREFRNDFRVVAVDLRGYGDSDKPGGVSNYTIQILVNDLKQLIDALGYKKCVLVGHDWGGLICWALAQTNPEMVDRFIVMNVPSMSAYIKHASSHLSQLKKSWYICMFQVPYIPEMNMHLGEFKALRHAFLGSSMGVRSGKMSEEDLEAYVYTFQRNGFTAPINYYRALCQYPDFAFSHLTHPDLKVSCPTLIIWGCQDGALDRELAALSAESVSGEVTVKYIENSSHWTPMDQPEVVNQMIREFLECTDKKFS